MQAIEKNIPCQYLISPKEKCGRNVYNLEYPFCEDHLKEVTRENILKIITNIINEQLSLEKEITPETNIFEDLDADSLELVEMIMEFENQFNITISDEDAEKLRTIGNVVDYLYDYCVSIDSYFIYSNFDYEKLIVRMRKKSENVKKCIDTILSSRIILDCLKEMDLSFPSISSLVYDIIGKNWVEHVTTVPVKGFNQIFEKVHILLLTKNFLFHLELRKKIIVARRISLSDIFLTQWTEFSSNGTINKIKIFWNVLNHDIEKNTNDNPFIFTDEEGIVRAKEFLKKFYSFKEKS